MSVEQKEKFKQPRKYVTSFIPDEKIAQPNQSKNTNLLLDIQRLFNENATIDGTSVKEILKRESSAEALFPGGKVQNLEQVKAFFKKYLVHKLPSEEQEAAIEHLLKTFHQGGYIYPASGPSALALKEHAQHYKDGKMQPMQLMGRDSNITIKTTSTGLYIQEEYMTGKVADPGGMVCKTDDNPLIFPDVGQDCVYGGKVELEVNFGKRTNKVLSNGIFYGNEAFREVIQSADEMMLDELYNQHTDILAELEKAKQRQPADEKMTTKLNQQAQSLVVKIQKLQDKLRISSDKEYFFPEDLLPKQEQQLLKKLYDRKEYCEKQLTHLWEMLDYRESPEKDIQGSLEGLIALRDGLELRQDGIQNHIERYQEELAFVSQQINELQKKGVRLPIAEEAKQELPLSQSVSSLLKYNNSSGGILAALGGRGGPQDLKQDISTDDDYVTKKGEVKKIDQEKPKAGVTPSASSISEGERPEAVSASRPK